MTIVPCWIIFHRDANGKFRPVMVEDSDRDANIFVRATAQSADDIRANWAITPSKRNNKQSNMSAPVVAGQVHLGIPDVGL